MTPPLFCWCLRCKGVEPASEELADHTRSDSKAQVLNHTICCKGTTIRFFPTQNSGNPKFHINLAYFLQMSIITCKKRVICEHFKALNWSLVFSIQTEALLHIING